MLKIIIAINTTGITKSKPSVIYKELYFPFPYLENSILNISLCKIKKNPSSASRVVRTCQF